MNESSPPTENGCRPRVPPQGAAPQALSAPDVPSPVTDACDAYESKQKAQEECRVCLEADNLPMVAPCICKGSLQFAHIHCLRVWVMERGRLECEICKTRYVDAVATELEAEYKSAQARLVAARGMALAAESALAMAVQQNDATRNDSAQSVFRTRKFWIYLICGIIILGAVVFVLVFLGLHAGNEVWAAVLLRVLAFTLPLFIVIRAIVGCYRLRRSNLYAANLPTLTQRGYVAFIVMRMSMNTGVVGRWVA